MGQIPTYASTVPFSPGANRNTIAQRDATGGLTGTNMIATAQLVGSALVLDTNTVAAAYTAKTTDYLIECNAAAGAFALTLPPVAAVAGQKLVIKKIDASGNAVTITPAGAETIDGSATKVLSAQWKLFELISDGTNWVITGVI